VAGVVMNGMVAIGLLRSIRKSMPTWSRFEVNVGEEGGGLYYYDLV